MDDPFDRLWPRFRGALLATSLSAIVAIPAVYLFPCFEMIDVSGRMLSGPGVYERPQYLASLPHGGLVVSLLFLSLILSVVALWANRISREREWIGGIALAVAAFLVVFDTCFADLPSGGTSEWRWIRLGDRFVPLGLTLLAAAFSITAVVCAMKLLALPGARPRSA